MSSVPWSNETERADYYKKLYNEQLAICDRIEKEVERLKGRLESSDKQLEVMKESNARLYLRFNTSKSEAVKEFAERFIKKIHENHYLLSDRHNSTANGMFTIGIEQAVNETKTEMEKQQ